METVPTVAPGIRRLTVNLDQDDVVHFEDVWPVPHGVALHAYLIQGDRTVVVDPWDEGGYGPEEIEADLHDLGLSWPDITAVAFTKPPRADLLPRLRAYHAGLEDWGVPAKGAHHDLGSGVTLEERDGCWFVTPGTALTGDAFSGLGWVEDELWADDLGEHDARYFDDEALRWFCLRPHAPVLPEGTLVVAPAHGCLWRQASKAVERARRFQAWGEGPALDEVTVVWPSGAEHDAGADALVGGGLDAGVDLNLFRWPGDDATAVAAGARRASLVVLAEGLDEGFLVGLVKDVWRPDPATPVADLRAGLVQRWGGE